MPIGVLYAIVAYSVYSCGDAIIKGFGQNLSVFEIGFFIALFSLIPALFVKPKGERWRDSFRLVYPKLVHLRSFTGVASSTLVTYAFGARLPPGRGGRPLPPPGLLPPGPPERPPDRPPPALPPAPPDLPPPPGRARPPPRGGVTGRPRSGRR